MNFTDYSIVDMPATLGRSVLKQDPNDKTKWIPDNSWYEETKKIYLSLIKFLIDKKLLNKSILETEIENVVIRISDLSDLGRAFVATGAEERWLASFDRPGSKKATDDVSYLERALGRLQSKES